MNPFGDLGDEACVARLGDLGDEACVARLGDLGEITPKELPTTYPPSLPHDLACCMSDEEVETLRVKYEYTPEEYEYILQRADFHREFVEWKHRLIAEGNSFKLKLRAMAEAYLPQLHSIITADTTAPSVKVDAFKYITKVAELEPTKADLEGASGSSAPKITINIAPYAVSPQQQVINIT